jgi:hypothetical protein
LVVIELTETVTFLAAALAIGIAEIIFRHSMATLAEFLHRSANLGSGLAFGAAVADRLLVLSVALGATLLYFPIRARDGLDVVADEFVPSLAVCSRWLREFIRLRFSVLSGVLEIIAGSAFAPAMPIYPGIWMAKRKRMAVLTGLSPRQPVCIMIRAEVAKVLLGVRFLKMVRIAAAWTESADALLGLVMK